MGLLDIFRASKIKAENETLKRRIEELHCDTYEQVKAKINDMESESKMKLDTMESVKSQLSNAINEAHATIAKLNENISSLNENSDKIQKQINTQTRKLQRTKEIYKSIEYCIDNFSKLPESDLEEYDEISPSVILKLHCMDIKDLRKAYRDTEKQVDKVLEQYSARYTTKANKTIYQLMVIALRAEMQNILYDLKYEKLDVAIDNVKKMTSKYLAIAGDGNQSIVGTLTKFIGEIEYLFIDEAKIEYNYYVKKEQAKQEQIAIREKMRQEVEDRKALEAERKKIEQEEAKYKTEIERLEKLLEQATGADAESLKAHIVEVESKMADVVLNRDKIAKLLNGKAGNIYIISNLGSFGENMFKIGMTRRLEPQERIDELGSASVPFKFDVHSFIFSEDAVGLENKLHTMLNDKRVNKVNRRKEFFYSTIEELENLVQNIDPDADFTRTMAAEEFRQSQSSDTVYTDDFVDDSLDDEEE